jgi:hypothetical protein
MAFTIDRVIRMTAEVVGNHYYPNGAAMFNDGDILFTVKDVQDASLNTSAELEDAVDGQGNVINQYLRSKTAEWSGNNALFDFGMAAAQFGDKVQTGSMTVEKTEVVEVAANGTTASVGANVKTSGKIKVYEIGNDGMTLASAVANVTASGKVLTVPSSTAARKLFVKYETEVADATKIENRADAAAIPFKLTVEALGNDTCSKSTSYLYITAPYAKMAPDFDWGISTESTHDFTINCMKDYCGTEGLFTVVKA